MTTISLTLDLNDEELSALQKRADEVQPEPLTTQSYLLRSLRAEIASYVEADFNAAVERLRTGAKNLPFEQRMALVKQVEQAIKAP